MIEIVYERKDSFLAKVPKTISLVTLKLGYELELELSQKIKN